MFQEKEKAEYKKITAPDGLKDRILSSYTVDCSAVGFRNDKKELEISPNETLENAAGGFQNDKEELREERKKKNRKLKTLFPKTAAVVAAAFVLGVGVYFGGTMFPRSSTKNNAVLFLYGNPVGTEPLTTRTEENEPVAVRMSARSGSKDLVLPLEINTEEKIRLSVSKGTIELFDPENENVSEWGTCLNQKGNCTLRWHVMPEKEEVLELKVEENGNLQVYLLSFDEEKQCYVLYQK